jgi:Gpi18-like mannosyltransferase
MQFNRKVLKVFFLSRLFVILFALVGTTFVGQSALSGAWNIQVPFFNLFARWDSGGYISIAKNGYALDSNWAFRPLFPTILKLSSIPLSPPLYIDVAMAIAGFIVNALLFLLALLIIHKLTKKLFSEKIADDTVLLVAFCPAAIFYSAVYSESLYLLLVAVSFLFLERGGVFKSGIFGYLAGLTRPEGIFTSLAISAKSLLTANKVSEKIKGLVSALIAFASLLTMVILGWIFRGDLNVIFSVEFSWDKITLIQAFNHPSWIIWQGFIEFYAVSLSMIAICVLTIFPFFLRNPKKILNDRFFPYYFCAACLVIFYLAVGDIRSLTRFFSTIIPVYWTLALWLGKKPYSKALIMLLFSIQLALGTILFINWYSFI